MGFARYPNFATVTFLAVAGTDTTNSIGVYTPGDRKTVVVKCRLEQSVTPQYSKDENQNTIEIDLDVFTPLMSETSKIRDGKADLTFAGQNYKIVQVPELQKMTNLKCSLNG